MIGNVALALALALVVPSCKQHDAPPPAPGSATVVATAPQDAPTADAAAPAPSLLTSTSPSVRALGAALLALDTDAARTWFDDRDKPRPDDVPPPAPPDDLRAAVDALLAWDRDPAQFDFPCNDQLARVPLGMLYTARAAPIVAPGDPGLRAALHLAEQLRRSETGTFAIAIGVGIAVEAARDADKHHVRSKLFELYEPTDDVAINYSRSVARCLVENLEHEVIHPTFKTTEEEYQKGRAEVGLPPGGSLPDEMPTLLAFWRETAAQLAAIHSPAELTKYIAARDKAAQEHPTSAFVRGLGRQFVTADHMLEQLAEYRKLVGQ